MVLTTMGFGGVPEVVFQLMRNLPRDRYATSLCVLKREADADNVCDQRRDRFAELGFDVHYAAESSRKLETVASVAQWIEDQELDVLHTHSNRPNVIGRMAGTLCRSSGLRIVAHYHNQYDDKWERDPAMLAFERRLAHTTDAMIAVSESVRQHVAANIGVPSSRLDVIGNGVDAAAFASGDRSSARAVLGVDDGLLLVGLVGRITEQKGQEDFVAAALRLCAVRGDVQFWMVGFAEDHALHQRLLQVVTDAGMAARIRFLGNRDDMARIYAALDLVVAPSRWEGFGIMLIEAMAAGRAIVASDTGAIPEIVRDGETAVLVPPRDVDALVAAMDALLRDPARRALLGAAGRRRGREFGWGAVTEKVAAVYERILRLPIANQAAQ